MICAFATWTRRVLGKTFVFDGEAACLDCSLLSGAKTALHFPPDSLMPHRRFEKFTRKFEKSTKKQTIVIARPNWVKS